MSIRSFQTKVEFPVKIKDEKEQDYRTRTDAFSSVLSGNFSTILDQLTTMHGTIESLEKWAKQFSE